MANERRSTGQEKVPARCSQCGKRFRVPGTGAAFRCPQCKGALELIDEAAQQAPLAAPVEPARVEPARVEPVPATTPAGASLGCEVCGAIAVDGAQFCAECSAALPGIPAHAPQLANPDRTPTHAQQRASPVRTPVRTPPRGKTQRAEAGAELVEAMQWITPLRMLFALRAGFLFVVLGGLLLIGGREVGAGLFVLAGEILAAIAVFNLAAAMLLRHQPFFWCVLVASLETLGVALALARGELPWVSLVWTAACWAAVFPMARVRRLMREHPDSYGAQMVAGTRDRARRAERQGEVSTQDHAAMIEAARKRAVMRTAIAASAVLTLSTAALVWRAGGPAPSIPGTSTARAAAPDVDFGPTAERFLASWRASDVEAIGDMFAGANRAENRGELREGLARRGWQSALPEVAKHTPSEDGERATLDLETQHGVVHTTWIANVSHSGDELPWEMDALELPRPDLQPFAREFADGWAKSGLDGVAGFVSGERAESFRNAFADASASRSWASAPALGAWTTKLQESDRGEVRYAIAGASLVVGCRIADGGRWRAESLGVETE